MDASATAVSGRKLAKPLTFRFTTPTVKLLRTSWYRRDGTVNGRMVVLLRFNQPVTGPAIAAALTAALAPHDWAAPDFTPEALARLRSRRRCRPGSIPGEGRLHPRGRAFRAHRCLSA